MKERGSHLRDGGRDAVHTLWGVSCIYYQEKQTQPGVVMHAYKFQSSGIQYLDLKVQASLG
jgi:hypothetical protein